MTKKRFTSDYNGDESLLTHFLDNEKPLTKKEVLSLLNNFYEENKELKNKLHFVMKRLNEKDKLLARVLEVNKNLEKKLKK